MLDWVPGVWSWVDAAALIVFLAAVITLARLIERSHPERPSLSRLMAEHRARWMAEMAVRDVRIYDSTLLAVQHSGAAFLASASLIVVGGVAALIGQTDQLLSVAVDLTGDARPDPAVWELKLLFLLLLMTVAFLSFVWSVRLFGYCAILLGATPQNGDHAVRMRAGERAARMNTRAGRSFNRGLRMIYFAFAAIAWLLGPIPFLLATLATVGMIYRREFLSETRIDLLASREQDS